MDAYQNPYDDRLTQVKKSNIGKPFSLNEPLLVTPKWYMDPPIPYALEKGKEYNLWGLTYEYDWFASWKYIEIVPGYTFRFLSSKSNEYYQIIIAEPVIMYNIFVYVPLQTFYGKGFISFRGSVVP
jgi:hypothetical protein